jgi:uncharacterized membrane protein YozB (DUF420 family)
MGTAHSLPGGRVGSIVPPAGERNRDHRFFLAMALAAALTAFVGFAPSYYLRSFSGAQPLTTLVHVHGALATAWMLLFLTQTALVSSGRTDLHRRLGVAGALLAPLFVVVGYVTAVEAARRGVAPPDGPPPLAFLAVPLGTLLAFTILAAAGLSQRRHRDTHKRLMLLATIAILTPALARFRYFGPGGPPVAIGGTALFVAVCLAYDRLAHGRVHPAFLWGGLFLVASLPLRFAVTRSEIWFSLAAWLTR